MAAASVTARRSGVDAAAELDAFATSLKQLPGDIAAAASSSGRQALLDAVAGRRGGLSVGRLGTLDVTAATTVSETSATVAMQATPPGPWAIVETGTRPHTIRRTRGLSVAPYGVFDRVDHPGVAGLYVWDGAVTAAETTIDTEAQRLADEAIPG